MDFNRADGPAPPPHSTLWFAIPACTVVLAVALGMLVGRDDSQASTAMGTSYDASNSGFRALYNILDELGYSIERSRHVAGGSVRWALAPMKPKGTDAEHVAEWVRHGGRLLLADAKGDLAVAVGVEVHVSDDSPADSIPTTIDDVKELAPGKTLIAPLGDAGRMWEAAGGEPLVTIHKVGDGEVWLLHRPLALANDQMKRGDNAIFAARLAEAMSEGKPGKIAVDEYCHGLRSRPGIIELLFQPPIRTAAIQGTLFVGLLLWGAAVRFGPLRALPPPRRRSKEEFLSALGDMLHRQGDTASAFRTIQGELVGQLAERVGLPPNTHPETVVATANRRRPMSPEVVHLLTCAAPPSGRAAFVAAIHSLDKASHELTRR
jgi:hypothetical protein